MAESGCRVGHEDGDRDEDERGSAIRHEGGCHEGLVGRPLAVQGHGVRGGHPGGRVLLATFEEHEQDDAADGQHERHNDNNNDDDDPDKAIARLRHSDRHRLHRYSQIESARMQ